LFAVEAVKLGIPLAEALAGRSETIELAIEATEEIGAPGRAEATSETMEDIADAAGWLAGRSEMTELTAEMIVEAAESTLAEALTEMTAVTEADASTGKSETTELTMETTDDIGASGIAEATSETIDEIAEAAGWLAGRSDMIELTTDKMEENPGSAGGAVESAGV